MERLHNLKEYLSKYLDTEFKKFYNFEMWRRVDELECLGTNINDALILFDKFGESFTPVVVTTRVLASVDAWSPCLSVTYHWDLKIVPVDITITLIKAGVGSVIIDNAQYLFNAIGESSINLVEEFEKNVVLMKVLRD
jgi:hypothetical protein